MIEADAEIIEEADAVLFIPAIFVYTKSLNVLKGRQLNGKVYNLKSQRGLNVSLNS